MIDYLKDFGVGLLVLGKICLFMVPFIALELYWEDSILGIGLILLGVMLICGLGSASRKSK